MAKARIHNHLNHNKTYQGIVSQVNASWENPGPKVHVMPAVDAYQKRLDDRVDLLSKIVTQIQAAYDEAKVNNKRAKKLLLDEMRSRTQVVAAQQAVRQQRKFSRKIRKDKADNFPPLPRHVTAHFKTIK